jgi:phage gpG-like protein
MTPQEAAKKAKEIIAFREKFWKEKFPRIIGDEAIKHFNESFVNEGFTDKTLKKWQNVERRKPESQWYGFSLGANSQNPNKKAKKAPEEGSKRKVGKTNFSPTRAKDKVLTGDSNDLKNSIKYEIKPDRVTVLSDKPYASVHQFGEPAMIFGKKSFTMKPRPFIGHSEILMNKILAKAEKQVSQEIDKIKKL